MIDRGMFTPLTTADLTTSDYMHFHWTEYNTFLMFTVTDHTTWGN